VGVRGVNLTEVAFAMAYLHRMGEFVGVTVCRVSRRCDWCEIQQVFWAWEYSM
jgi:hypothetical protein